MKKILSLALSGILLTQSSFAFSDLTTNHWSYYNVMNMQKEGIVSGYNDGTFKPDAPLTREQFISMLVNALELDKEYNKNFSNFIDIDNRWSTKYIQIAGNYLTDYGEIKFNPSEPVLREDVAMALVKANGLEYTEYYLDYLENFSDFNNISENRKKYVAIAVEYEFMNGNSNGTFNPKGVLTRAEGATVIGNILKKYIENFSEGIAIVRKSKGDDLVYGYIDSNGKELNSCTYAGLGDFSEGLGNFQNKYDYKWGYLNKDGDEVIPSQYTWASQFSEGMASVEKNGKWGFINRDGDEVIPFIYDYAYSFSDGLAIVSNRNDKNEIVWSYINKNGKKIISVFGYDKVNPFYGEIAVVERNGKMGCINKNGKEIIPCNYDHIENFSDEAVKILIKNAKLENYSIVSNAEWILMNKNGKQISSKVYNSINKIFDGIAMVKINEKYGFIDEKGNEIIPFIYDEAASFSEGLAPVKKDGKWGYINISGEEVIPFIYSSTSTFSEGLAFVEIGNLKSFINKEGKEIINCNKYYNAFPFSEGVAIVEIYIGKYGYINKEGKEIVPCIYRRAWDFSDGLAKVSKEDGKIGFINKEGIEVIPRIYSEGGR